MSVARRMDRKKFRTIRRGKIEVRVNRETKVKVRARPARCSCKDTRHTFQCRYLTSHSSGMCVDCALGRCDAANGVPEPEPVDP